MTITATGVETYELTASPTRVVDVGAVAAHTGGLVLVHIGVPPGATAQLSPTASGARFALGPGEHALILSTGSVFLAGDGPVAVGAYRGTDG